MKVGTLFFASVIALTACSAPESKEKTPNGTSAENASTNNATTNHAATNHAATNGATNVGTRGALAFDVETVVFVSVVLGETDEQSFSATNIGGGVVTLTGATIVEETLDDPGGAEFTRGAWPEMDQILPGEWVTFSVRYSPLDRVPDAGYVELSWHDGEADRLAKIRLVTPDLSPRIFANENIIFSGVPPVDESTRDTYWQLTEIQNVGQAPLQISDIVITPSSSDFSVSFPETLDPDADPATDGSEPGDWTLHPDGSLPVRIYFNPVDDLPSSAEMIIFSNDPQTSEYVVQLRGN